MKNNTPFFAGFHIKTLGRKRLSTAQQIAAELAQLKQKNVSQLAGIKAQLKAELFRLMKSQNDYLSEKEGVTFLKVGMHELDQPTPKFNYDLPAEQVGVLKGKKRDPHKITAP